MSSGTRQAWPRSVTALIAGLLGVCALSCGATPSNACMTSPPGRFGAALGRSAGLCRGLGSWSCSTPGFGGLLKAANPETSKKKRNQKEKETERKPYTYWQNCMEIVRVRCFGVASARHVKVSDATKWQDITLLHSGDMKSCCPNRSGHKPSSMAR